MAEIADRFITRSLSDKDIERDVESALGEVGLKVASMSWDPPADGEGWKLNILLAPVAETIEITLVKIAPPSITPGA